jgi:alkanesulfonate monooxygenase SsuD/methylene tetrahydromethanopterin reductase-like flavin-dependent oxidoreductase (luciferase family)
MIRVGLYAPNFGTWGDASAVAELAREAEGAGWDGLFLWDHIARSIAVDVVDPWVALTAAAMSTARIRLGALVTPLARRRPWKVAREVASLDRLSGGRLVFGAGLGSGGGSEVEWAAFGEETDLRVRAQMLDEALEVLEGLWSGREFGFSGRHYQVARTRFTPTPLQQPRVPIWLAGYWPNRAPFRRAARFDGAFPLLDPARGPAHEQLREVAAFLRDLRPGGEPFDLVHLGEPRPGEPARGAAEIARCSEAGATWWLDRLAPEHFGGEWTGTWPAAAMLEHVRRGPPGR